MSILVSDHEEFHAAVARTVLAAGGASVLGLFLPATLAAAAMALAVGLAVVVPSSWRSAAVALLCACAAGAAATLGPVTGGALAALAVGASVGRELESTPRRLLAGALGALGMAGAALVGKAFAATGALAFLPSGLEVLVGGAAGGLMVGVSSVGRHVTRAPALAGQTEEAELLAAAAGDSGELGQLLLRAADAYRAARVALGTEAPEVLAAADDLVGKMARFGRRWREIEREAARSKPEELAERLATLDQKLLAASDPMVRTELARAREAIAAQVSALDDISRGRDRALARLTHQVAMLERLRLSAVRHRSVDATRLGVDLAPVVDELTSAGSDLDTTSEALAEATQTTASLSAPGPDPAPALPPAAPATETTSEASPPTSPATPTVH